jgi:DNA-binding response OmpR family regulator
MATHTILIVDDDADMRRSMGLRLSAAGYTPVFAADAVAVLAVAKKEKPSLILLDIGLPGGDGFVVLRRLQSIPALANTPVVVVSGRDVESYRELAHKAGVAGCFQKPVDNELLLAAIADALKASTGTATPAT